MIQRLHFSQRKPKNKSIWLYLQTGGSHLNQLTIEYGFEGFLSPDNASTTSFFTSSLSLVVFRLFSSIERVISICFYLNCIHSLINWFASFLEFRSSLLIILLHLSFIIMELHLLRFLWLHFSSLFPILYCYWYYCIIYKFPLFLEKFWNFLFFLKTFIVYFYHLKWNWKIIVKKPLIFL